VNRRDREAHILRRAHEIAMTGKHIGRNSIEAKLRFELGESPGIEILVDQHFSAELDRICAEASVLRARRSEAKRGCAEAVGSPTEIPRPRRRRLNAEQKRALKAAGLRVFVQQYARKAQKNTEPNDRRYDWNIEQAIRRMNPVLLDRLLRDDEEED
jgi:hypothetical protein